MAAFPIGVAHSAEFEAKPVWLNGSPAGRIEIGGELETAFNVSVENGRITPQRHP